MTLRSDYISGNLACQNWGDCSLFNEPMQVNNEQQGNSNSQDDSQITRILKKISAMLALSLLMSLIILI